MREITGGVRTKDNETVIQTVIKIVIQSNAELFPLNYTQWRFGKMYMFHS